MSTNKGLKNGGISNNQLKQINSNLDKPLDILTVEKFNALNTSINNKSVIKSIQFAQSTIRSDLSIKINPVNVSKTMVVVTSASEAPPDGSRNGNIGVYITSISSIYINVRAFYAENTSVSFSIQVIEFY